jgi:hypothetical protein
MPVDNLSVDSNGDIWAASVLKTFDIVDVINDTFNKGSPTTIFKIHGTMGGKCSEANFVSGATVVVFDSAPGRLFAGGI